MKRTLIGFYTLLAILGHAVKGSFVAHNQVTTHRRSVYIKPTRSCVFIMMDTKSNKPTDTEIISRNHFIQFESKALISVLLLLPFLNSPTSSAFDGGVGGLGKSKPDTGVIFANADLPLTFSGGNDISTELFSPDRKTVALLSFYAPWPLLRSTTGIESRDLANPEAAFVLVSPTTHAGIIDASNIPQSYFEQTIFGPSGKFGMYGTVSDLKVKKVQDKKSTSIYLASFTTL